MSRDDLKSAIGGNLDMAVYEGETLPGDFFDDLDDSSSLLQEIDDLKQQIELMKVQPVAVDDMMIGRFELSPVGLIAPDDATPEEFGHVGKLLFKLDSSLQWLIGDWLMMVGSFQWGDTGTLSAHFGRKAQTLYNWKLVSKNIQFSRRRENLSYTHHTLVAALDDDQQAYWLDMAINGDVDPTDENKQIQWSVARLRNEIKIAYRPTLPAAVGSDLFDFKQKSKEIGKFGRVVMKSVAGDEQARREALGWIAERRRWLEEIEEMLNDG